MIKNDKRDMLSFGSSMGCYLSLALVYLEVTCELVHLSKKDNDSSMKSCMFIILYYSYVIHVIPMSIVD